MNNKDASNEPPLKPTLLREFEFFGGCIRVKISVKNTSSLAILDAALELESDERILHYDRCEPEYPEKKGKIQLGNINPNSDRTVAFYLDPLICAKEGTDVNCHVSFKDAFGRPDSVQMETLKIKVVCPIFRTEQDINIGRLKELVSGLQFHDSKVYTLPKRVELPELLGTCRNVIQLHDVCHIKTFKTTDEKTYEAWYYGKTKVTKKDLVIKFAICKDTESIEVFASGNDPSDITGLLAEIGRNLTREFERLGKVQPVFNIHIKDSIIRRSNLLSFCDIDGTCGGNVVIEDGVVQRSSIASWNEVQQREREEAQKREKEEQERLRREEEERRKRIEAERREREEQERLRRQKEQEERALREREEQERQRREEEERRERERKAREKKEEEERFKPRIKPKEEILPSERLEQEGEARFISQYAEKVREEEERLRKEKEEQERTAREKEELRAQEEGPSYKKFFAVALVLGVLVLGYWALVPGATKSTPFPFPDPPAGQNTFTNSIGMEFVLIPSGEFDMGSPANDKDRYSDESPVHRVKISNAFYMGKYEVTQKQWREIMGNNPSSLKGDNLPVDGVSWDDVEEFIKKLNEKEGTNKYRLPSEAEWEYAARADTTTRYSFGDDESKLGDYAWYYGNSGGKTHEVGQKKPNPWGLYDTYGNVWEWVQDNWHDNYNGAPTDGSAWEGVGSDRVTRGGDWGSWDSGATRLRSASRHHNFPAYRDFNLGFRLLRIS